MGIVASKSIELSLARKYGIALARKQRYRYLTWVLKAAPKLKEQNQFDELVSTLLPANAPEECRTGKKPANDPADS